MKYIVSFLCFLIVVLSFLFSDIVKFDKYSFALFILGLLSLSMDASRLSSLLEKLRETFKSFKVTTSGVETIFNDIQEVEKNLIEVKKDSPQASNAKIKAKEALIDYYGKLTSNISNPKAAVILTGLEIEKTISLIADKMDIDTNDIPSKKILSKLNELNVITSKTSFLIVDFLNVKNNIIHNKNVDLSSDVLTKTIEIGQEILILLKSIELNEL